MKTITINCSQDEANLIERALELYSRVGLCQFDDLTLCNSLQKEIWKSKLSQEFQDKTDELKSIFGLSKNASWSILNKENVHDDVRIAAHLHQAIRHERYKDRIATGEQTEKHYTVDEYPADICQLAEMNIPKFKIEITNE